MAMPVILGSSFMIQDVHAYTYTYDDDYGYGYDYDYDDYDYYDNDYDYIDSSDDGDSFKWGASILIAVVIGLVAAGITTGVMYSQLKNVKLQTRAENYVVNGSMNVTEARDLFLYQHTTRIAKPKKNNK